MAEWEKAARENPRAAKLERLQLINAIPRLFDRIADIVEQSLAGGLAELSPEEAGRHALDRLKEGFDHLTKPVDFAALDRVLDQLGNGRRS